MVALFSGEVKAVETAARREEPEQGQQKVVSFPWGIPGLVHSEYTLSIPAGEMPFYFLRSVEDPGVGLLLVNPFMVYRDYEIDISDEVTGRLKIADAGQVAVLCTVNTSRGLDRATVNLMAPIVINTENMTARQVVLHDSGYSLRHPLFLGAGAKKEEP